MRASTGGKKAESRVFHQDPLSALGMEKKVLTTSSITDQGMRLGIELGRMEERSRSKASLPASQA